MNNYSKQREIILETFKYLNHPTAEQIKKEKLKELIHNQTSVITNVDSIILYGICEECKSKIKYEEE